MIKYTILAVAFLWCNPLNAQTEKHFYSKKQVETTEDSAKSYAEFTRKGDIYEALQYSLSGELLLKGHYASVAKNLNQDREGYFEYYNNHRIIRAGSYAHNLRTGLWKAYAYSNGKLLSERHYVSDSLEGHCIYYNPSTDSKLEEGDYVNGKQEGTWTYYAPGMKTKEMDYAHGARREERLYSPDGKVVRRLTYTNNKLTGGHAYGPDGTEREFVPKKTDSTASVFQYVEQLPRAPFNLNSFLVDNLHYPKKAMHDGIQGRVKVRFVVDEQGKVVDPEIIEGVSPELDAEALRVVSLMPAWVPGKQNGEPVKVYYTLPINFKL